MQARVRALEKHEFLGNILITSNFAGRLALLDFRQPHSRDNYSTD